MPRVKGLLVDVDYVTGESDESRIRLHVKVGGEKKIFSDPAFRPYFYIIADDAAKRKEELAAFAVDRGGQRITPAAVESLEKEGEENVLKLSFRSTLEVTLFREALKDGPGVVERREYDIPFVKRYMIDRNLEPLNGIAFDVDGAGNVSNVEKFEWPNALNDVNIGCLDIETVSGEGRFCDARLDPIVMIGYVDKTGPTVFTWKDCRERYVKSFAGEKQMLQAFMDFVREKNLDFLVTYNGDLFDFPYLRDRGKVLGVKVGFGVDGSEPKLVRKGLDNAAELTGVQHIDAYQLIRVMNRLGIVDLIKFDLESVVRDLFAFDKEKVGPDEINAIWAKGEGLARLANYNKEDVEYTLKLAMRFLPLVLELSKLTKQSPFDVSRGSTGILVEYLLLDKAYRTNQLAPNKPDESVVKQRTMRTFKGGYVRSPIQGLHENIAVLDFRSLHPSIIISHNISPNTLNCGCCRGTTKNLSPDKDWFCEKKPGFFPSLLKDILERRIAIKEQMKSLDEVSDEYQSLHARQWALKILLNSFYGVLGYPRFRWYSWESARAVTAWSRHYIRETAQKAEELGYQVLYGDSLTGDRCVVLQAPDGQTVVRPLNKLFHETEGLVGERRGKQFKRLRGWRALSVNPNTLESEWKPVTEIIRHKTGKRVYRVGQKFGETRVTEDHSLMVRRFDRLVEAKPTELGGRPLFSVSRVFRGTEVKGIDVYSVLESYYYDTMYKGNVKIVQPKKDGDFVSFGWMARKEPVKVKRFIEVGSPAFESLCRLLGAYLAEGSSSTVETTATREGASISSSDTAWLAELQEDYYELFGNATASIIRSSPGMRTLSYSSGGAAKQLVYEDSTHKLQMMNGLAAVFFRQFCGQKSAGKRLPDFIFNVPERYQRLLLEKYLEGDGSNRFSDRYSKAYRERHFVATTKSLELASGLSLLLKQLGIVYSIQFRPEKGTYSLRSGDRHNSRLDTRLTEEPYDGFVYDLAVEDNHNFVDACGLVCVHNTDSVFLLVPKGKQEADVKAFVHKVNGELPGDMELEYEGFFKRGIFVTKKEGGAAKKRYALIDFNNRLKIVGFEYVRRDWSRIAKDTQRSVIEGVLKEGNPDKAIRVVREAIERLKSGKVPLKELAIVTVLQKSPGSYEQMGPHIAAAKKAIERGKDMGVGSVIEYVITRRGKGSGKAMTQKANSISDKAELLEFAEEGDYDADYYVEHQVVPAVIKIMRELGLSEQDLVVGGKQSSLGAFV